MNHPMKIALLVAIVSLVIAADPGLVLDLLSFTAHLSAAILSYLLGM